MKSRLFLNVVIGQSPAVLQLLAGKDQPLLVRRNSLLILQILSINGEIIRNQCKTYSQCGSEPEYPPQI
jgi:hypothetical protein